MPQISVIIPHFNDPARLDLCLNALSKQSIDSDQFEVIVVDNGSKKLPTDVINKYVFATLEVEKKRGSYAARNCGLAAATGSIIAFTDADCLPDTQWLQNGVERISHLTDGGLVAGRIVVFPRDQSNPTAAELYDMVVSFDQKEFVERGHFGATANVITTRATIGKVGPFNEKLMSSGDVDFGKRVHKTGLPLVYDENVVIRHPARDTLRALMKKQRRSVAGRIDRHGKMRSKKTLLSIIKVFWRAVAPRFSRLKMLAKDERLTTFGQRMRVIGVEILLHYVTFYERIRKRLGGRSTRE